MTKKTIIYLIIAIVIIGGIWYGVSSKKSETPAEEEPIKIGATLPLSGGAASLGENAKNGIEMALQELREQGLSIQIIYEDDQFDVQKTVNAFHKLVDMDGIKYIITLGSNNGNAIGPIAQEGKIVHVAIATDPKVLEYSFSVKNGSDPIELARAMTEECLRRDYKKIYILSTNHEGVLSIVNEFKKQEKIADKIIGEELIDPAESDFKTILAKAKEKEPDAILLEIIPGKVGLAAKQARQLGIDIPLFAAVVFEDQNAINAAEGTLENQWYANSNVAAEFAESYKNQFNAIPSREASNGFDSVMLINQAIKVVGDNPEKVNVYLHELQNFASFSIDGGVKVENGNFINFAIIKTIKNGQFVPYEETKTSTTTEAFD